MADKSNQLILDALSRAAADPVGLPLHGNKSIPGLFPVSPPARQVAQRCVEEGLLRVVRTDTRGKAPLHYCAVTEKGLAHLLRQVSPRQVLEDFVRVLEARQEQVNELVAAARSWQIGLDALKRSVEQTLTQLRATTSNGHASTGPVWPELILTHLDRWTGPGDYPLPDLYRQAREQVPALTLGQFHDGLRRLHEDGRIYLHPWTGPLHDMPEPACALLTGHEIAYYASIRNDYLAGAARRPIGG